jgi:hypothetical protein
MIQSANSEPLSTPISSCTSKVIAWKVDFVSKSIPDISKGGGKLKMFKVVYWAFGLQGISIVAAKNEEKAERMVSDQLNKNDIFILERVSEIDLSQEGIVYTDMIENI